MDATLRAVTDLAEALELAPVLDRYAGEAMAEFRDEPLPEGVARRFLEAHFDAPETLLLVAERPGELGHLGVCLVGPLTDPLTAERLPLVLILHVLHKERHRGLARRMVHEAGQRLQRRGLSAFAARAGHNDDALISMGERWGFVRLWELMVRE